MFRLSESGCETRGASGGAGGGKHVQYWELEEEKVNYAHKSVQIEN